MPKADVKRMTANVTVHTRDGVVHHESYDAGQPAKDLDRQWDKLTAKFRVEPVPGKDKTAKIIEAVRTLETAKDVSTLAALLS